MYNSYEEFKKDALACGKDYYSDRSLEEERLHAAYNIYRTASLGTKLRDVNNNPVNFGVTIVGRLALKTKKEGTDDEYVWQPSDESFPSIDEIMKDNLMTVDQESEQAGSILDAGLWSILANDGWLLGGIHAKTEFHFASPLRWENLWDANANRMTITARETIGILSFGFKIKRPNPKLEAVAYLEDDEAASNSSLIKYKEQILKYPDYNTMQSFYANVPSEAK